MSTKNMQSCSKPAYQDDHGGHHGQEDHHFLLSHSMPILSDAVGDMGDLHDCNQNARASHPTQAQCCYSGSNRRAGLPGTP